MRPKFKNFPTASRMMFAPGASSDLQNVIDTTVPGNSNYVVYIIDHFFKDGALAAKLGVSENDIVYYLDTTDEPKTATIDDYVAGIKKSKQQNPDAVVGAGGGSTLDVAKAVSIMLTNDGKTEEYQGWDLVKNEAVYKIAIPTLSGTGSEVSRTTVLTGPVKKQGINSDQSVFNQVIMDPELTATVPTNQRFYSAMDCYIHCVEGIMGTFLNAFSKAYSEKALDMCKDVFLGSGDDADLMVASMFGGYSVAYSEVGVCHALSYGLSFFLGYHHGEANCIVFNYLDDYYPQHVTEFREMVKKHNIYIPENVTKDVDDETLEKMVDITLLMERPLNNALGDNWKEKFTRDTIKELYRRM